jgi:outer membrane murein-binding lipoprotein Lpp
MPVLDTVLFGSLLLATIVVAGASGVRLAQIASQIRSLEAERALQE